VVRSLIMAPSDEDWRSWILHVSDEHGDEIFDVPFTSILLRLCAFSFRTRGSWTPQQDATLMIDLHKVHDRLTQEGRLGPAARLGATNGACVLRGRGKGVVTDGPFAETKEQLLGFYVIDCADRNAAIAVARDLRAVNPSRCMKSARSSSISQASPSP
jgi:hypothetical protein